MIPIALFVYNRPEHTKKTLEKLQENHGASNFPLYIFSDAPKKEEHTESVELVRSYIKTITGFASVAIKEQTENQGLARSITEGVRSLFNTYEQIIVLEDDLITSPYFLTYMKDALTIYKDEKKVMHINGYCPPLNIRPKEETFFFRLIGSWGWATWRDRWSLYEDNPKFLLEQLIKRKKLSYLDLDNNFRFSSTLHANIRKDIETWAIKWYATVVLNGGLALYPSKSLVYNSGHDNTGEHAEKTSVFDVEIARRPIQIRPRDVTEDPLTYTAMIEFYSSLKPTLIQKIKERFKKYL